MRKRGTYPKKEQNANGVMAKYDLLIKGLESPDSIKPSIAKSLAGQNAFAHLSVAGTKITAMSLNTMKSLANKLFAEQKENMKSGYAYLDSLRIQLRAIINKRLVARTAEAKERRISQKTDDLKQRLDQLEIQNILRSKAYMELYGNIHMLLREGSIEEMTRMRLYRILENHYSLYNELFDSVAHPEKTRYSDGRNNCGLTLIQCDEEG